MQRQSIMLFLAVVGAVTVIAVMVSGFVYLFNNVSLKTRKDDE